MSRQPCQLTIYTHEYDEEGNELDGLHYISYNKRIFVPYEKNGNKKKSLHKKTKSVNLGGNNNNKNKNLEKSLKKERSKNNLKEEKKTEKQLKKNNSSQKMKMTRNKTPNKKLNDQTLKSEKELFIQTDPNYNITTTNNKNLTSSIGFVKSLSNVSSNINNSFYIKKSFLRTKSSKSPINKVKVNPKKEEIISSSISDIIQIKEKINKLIEEECELENQRNDIINHFEYKLQPMRELNKNLVNENKDIIEKEEKLQNEFKELKNKHEMLVSQHNEKGNLLNKLNDNYEKELDAFERKQKEDKDVLENYFKDALQKISNGELISLDLP